MAVFLAWLPAHEQRDAREVHTSVPVRDGLRNPFGIIHGGICGSITEGVAAAATLHRVHADGRAAIGRGNDARMLHPISEETIHARAERSRPGRTTWLWDVHFHDDKRLCATSRVTIAVRTYDGPPSA